MASANIALVCGLNFHVGCQDRLRVNSDVIFYVSIKDEIKLIAYQIWQSPDVSIGQYYLRLKFINFFVCFCFGKMSMKVILTMMLYMVCAFTRTHLID